MSRINNCTIWEEGHGDRFFFKRSTLAMWSYHHRVSELSKRDIEAEEEEAGAEVAEVAGQRW